MSGPRRELQPDEILGVMAEVTEVPALGDGLAIELGNLLDWETVKTWCLRDLDRIRRLDFLKGDIDLLDGDAEGRTPQPGFTEFAGVASGEETLPAK